MILPGETDIEAGAEDLAAKLPESLGVLAHLAYNYRWAWHPRGSWLFSRVNANRWRLASHNPVRLLEEATHAELERVAADAAFCKLAADVASDVRADLSRPDVHTGFSSERPIAFMCAEFGIHESLPIYSGGLGVLAGDIVKQASDMALPMFGVGIMYRLGYFRQRIDIAGWQHEYWVETDPWRTPAVLVTGDDGLPLRFGVTIRGREVLVRIWRVNVGRTPLFLLDTDLVENNPLDRWITSQLYVGDPDTRRAQYVLLGIGGIKAVAALGLDPALLHLNEGHAAFAPLALAHDEVARGTELGHALDAARAMTVFTTHTPVAAGNETYEPDEITTSIGALRDEMGLDPAEFLGLGRTDPDNKAEPFGITQLGLHMSRSANGVSRRHGEVAREMWRDVFSDRDIDDVPIGYVTNGVHVPTWIGAPMRELLDRYLGDGWIERAGSPATWEPVDDIPDAELWNTRVRQRRGLVEWARNRVAFDRLKRGETADFVQDALDAFAGDTLTLGFARRVATYKRLSLLVRDRERTLRLLGRSNPVQIFISGKAHPKDDAGKAMLHDVLDLRGEPNVGRRIAVLHDYSMYVAAHLVRGCDVWINVPRPPLEASGTSGMKAAVNGCLNLSVLDGWWAEGYNGENGWAISGKVSNDHERQDALHAEALMSLLENEVIPMFYDRDADGVPLAWVQMIKSNLKSNGPAFSAARMLGNYITDVYAPD